MQQVSKSNTSPVSDEPTITAQLLLAQFVLALALRELLTRFPWKTYRTEHILAAIAMLILVVWVAQLLEAWRRALRSHSSATSPFKGLVTLWALFVFMILVFLPCQSVYARFTETLVFLTSLLFFDLVWSLVGWTTPFFPGLQSVHRNWFFRDIGMGVLLAMAWTIHVRGGHDLQQPTVMTGTVLLIALFFGYAFDMWSNWRFYWQRAPSD